MLAFRDVSRRYDRTLALAGVSFELAEGSFTVLLGANGSGKSTLLRLGATLDQPTSGEVAVGGADARTRGVEARRHVAYLGQEPGLYGELTVRENLTFVADFYGKTFALEHAARAVGIETRLEERARTLSRGQRQRAALARALLAGDLLLLDEPTTGLDATGTTQLLDALATLKGTRTTLVATHEPLLISVADRVLVLDKGSLVLDGSPSQGRQYLEALA